LRGSPADGAALVLQNARGVFRLAGNERPWDEIAPNKIQVAFQAVEAL